MSKRRGSTAGRYTLPYPATVPERDQKPMNADTTRLYNDAEVAVSRTRFKKDPDKSIRTFKLSPPTGHELQVIRAMEQFLSNDRESFLDYRVLKGSKMPEVTVETYDKFRDRFRHYLDRHNAALILRWAMLLHDIAKGRGPEEPHCEASGKIAHRIFRHKKIESIKPLQDHEKRLISWIAQHHDMMGNIYTGERVAGYLNKITSRSRDVQGKTEEEFRPERKKGFAFLQFAMLCDLRGTAAENAYGAYLTDDKANFWLRLSAPARVKELTRDLYKYRRDRWTGSLDGSLDEQKSESLRCMDGRACRIKSKIADYFGRRIHYIVNGYYALDALDTEELAELMARVVEAPGVDQTSDNEPLRLKFTKGYRKGKPDSELMLKRLKAALRTEKRSSPLRIEYRRDTNCIEVDTKGLLDPDNDP